MRRFACQPCDAAFLESAPFRVVHVLDLPVPVERAWAQLTGEDPLGWCRVITGARWTSPEPHDIGATRNVRIAFGALTLNERYFRWEAGRRKSFFAQDANLPLFRRLAEDYLLEATAPSACRFTWTIGADPQPWARPANPLQRLLLGTLARDTRRHFDTTEQGATHV